MKKFIAVICLTVAICLCFTGCKSEDYKQAMALQDAGDYTAAAAIYSTLGDYEDSADRFAACNAMIAAIEAYDSAAALLSEKNTELDAAVAEAQGLVTDGAPTLDDTLVPALQTAISEATAARKEGHEMPGDADAITVAAEEMNAVDYSTVLTALSESRSALEESIAQYALVDAPSEAYIIECLLMVPGIVDIAAVTEDNDPNGNLNKAGGYTSQVYFSSELIDQNSVYGTDLIDKATDSGGSIEVYSTVEDAEKRNIYLGAFDGTFLASGSHCVIGTVLVRTSNKLTATQQKELEANIIAVLTSVED